LARRRPLLAASLVICLLGLVGTPPTAVFVGKLEAFSAAFDGGYAWLVVLAAVNTVASLFYYLRWIVPVVSSGAPEHTHTGGQAPRLIAYGSAAASLALGLAAGPVLALLDGPLAG
jgi:NADH-quinone oxidoreductase subunit N